MGLRAARGDAAAKNILHPYRRAAPGETVALASNGVPFDNPRGVEEWAGALGLDTLSTRGRAKWTRAALQPSVTVGGRFGRCAHSQSGGPPEVSLYHPGRRGASVNRMIRLPQPPSPRCPLVASPSGIRHRNCRPSSPDRKQWTSSGSTSGDDRPAALKHVDLVLSRVGVQWRLAIRLQCEAAEGEIRGAFGRGQQSLGV